MKKRNQKKRILAAMMVMTLLCSLGISAWNGTADYANAAENAELMADSLLSDEPGSDQLTDGQSDYQIPEFQTEEEIIVDQEDPDSGELILEDAADFEEGNYAEDEILEESLAPDPEENLTEEVPDLEDEMEEDSIISVASMLPLKEVKACLLLDGYSNEQLKSVPLDTILGMLIDENGNKINIPETAKTVWTYYKDAENNILRDEYHVVGRDETVDLSIYADVPSYRLELIVGSGQQLDADSIRYLVRVYVSREITERLGFELYRQDANANRTKVIPERITMDSNDQFGFLSIQSTIFTVPDHVQGTKYYLGMSSEASQHPNITLDVYTQTGFYQYLVSGEAPTLNDQLLNQDMTKPGAGYYNTFDMPQTVFDTNGFFYLVYKNRITKEMISYYGAAFTIVSEASYVDGTILDYQNGQMVDAVCFRDDSVNVNDFGINTETGGVTASGSQEFIFMLKKGFDADSELYCAMDSFGVEYGDAANSYVTKAVLGFYDSPDEAAQQPDIKELLIPVDRDKKPLGYKANYNYQKGGQKFTIFYEDGNYFKIKVGVVNYNPKYDENYVREYTDAPIVGEKDPWFRITGLKLNNEDLDCYVVENGKAINMDTYYGYGYQTILAGRRDNTGKLVPLTSEELKHLKPVFEVGDPDRVKIALEDRSGYLVSGENEVDFSNQNETVHFIAGITDEDGTEHSRNYYVRVISKTQGPKLYVYDGWIALNENGEYENLREVLLDEYFEQKHDILIANVGDQPLTGLKVKLDATNVKLDDYWTVGGSGNDSLAPFTQTTDLSEYGYLDNIAKIRLLPDGDGPIEGYLTISADGQKDVVIHISDKARQPVIVTKQLEDTVKYVPYSFFISTNNMYDWNTQTFSISAGALPDGMSLNPGTGEIYGAPTVPGTYTFTVRVDYSADSFEASEKEFKINVADNLDQTVFETSDENYFIIAAEGGDVGYVGEQISAYRFELYSLGQNEIYISNGEFGLFKKVWLNGVELTPDEYQVSEGSTRIVISSQTLEDHVREGRNTISAEFNVNDERGDNLRRTSQNFYYIPAAEPTTAPTEPTTAPAEPTTAPAEPTTAPAEPTTAPAGPTTAPAGPTTAPAGPTKAPEGPTAVPTEPITDTDDPGRTPGATLSPAGQPVYNPSAAGRTGSASSGSASSSNRSTTPSAGGNTTPSASRNSGSIGLGSGVSIMATVESADGTSLTGYTLELHSRVRTGKIDGSGQTTFSDVEMGDHTFELKDKEGSAVASKKFSLVAGSAVSVAGDKITVIPGQTIGLKLTVDGSKMSISDVVSKRSSVRSPVTTGDDNNLEKWILIAFMAIAVVLILTVKKVSVRNRK